MPLFDSQELSGWLRRIRWGNVRRYVNASQRVSVIFGDKGDAGTPVVGK